MKKTILVTGARGYIASYVQNLNKEKFNQERRYKYEKNYTCNRG